MQIRPWLTAIVLCGCSVAVVEGETSPSRAPAQRRMGRLRATLTAEPGWDLDMSLENVTFYLANRSRTTLLSRPETWVLVVDGRVAPDLGRQLWMGWQTPGGYGTVPAGATFRFGKGLSRAQYFPADRDYRLSWRAAGFHSNVVVVRGGPPRSPGPAQ